MKTKLHSYQLRSVAWMIKRELEVEQVMGARLASSLADMKWHGVDTCLLFDLVNKCIVDGSVPDKLDSYRNRYVFSKGGILADEMVCIA